VYVCVYVCVRLYAVLFMFKHRTRAWLRYNERTDQLAGAAVTSGDLNLMASDICALIAHTIRERERGQRIRHCPCIDCWK
jgi:hypothetical protein